MSLRRLRARVAALAVALAACAAVSFADGPAPVCPAIDPPAAAAAPAAAGVRAAIDPETGALRPPTAEELAAASARKRAARAEAMRDVRIVDHPNGMRTAELGDALRFDVVVERRPDGTLGYRCVPKHAAAQPEKESR